MMSGGTRTPGWIPLLYVTVPLSPSVTNSQREMTALRQQIYLEMSFSQVKHDFIELNYRVHSEDLKAGHTVSLF
jgi:hypothetical protein